MTRHHDNSWPTNLAAATDFENKKDEEKTETPNKICWKSGLQTTVQPHFFRPDFRLRDMSLLINNHFFVVKFYFVDRKSSET